MDGEYQTNLKSFDLFPLRLTLSPRLDQLSLGIRFVLSLGRQMLVASSQYTVTILSPLVCDVPAVWYLRRLIKR